jgi:hypothetical protein
MGDGELTLGMGTSVVAPSPRSSIMFLIRTDFMATWRSARGVSISSLCGAVSHGGRVGNLPTLIGTWSLLTSVIVLVVASADILSKCRRICWMYVVVVVCW